MAERRFITDTDGFRYELGQPVGKGGQGVVHGVRGEPLAAKLLYIRSAARGDGLRNRLSAVKRMDLSGVRIARPLATLRAPEVGYLMELKAGYRPLLDLARPPRDGIGAWYVETGGLRMRLQVLASAAEELAAIHGRGLVYADPSPGNILFREGDPLPSVTLIDADNLHFESSPGSVSVFTPWYAAPEVNREEHGVDSLTDAFAFAVIAFETLTLAHPFMGDEILDGDPDLEQKALVGEVAWIDDPEDDSNERTGAAMRAALVSARLRELFQRTFGLGRSDSKHRARMTEWAQWLYAASFMTLDCSACGSSYFPSFHLCPWCKEQSGAFANVYLQIADPEDPDARLKGGEGVVAALVLQEGRPGYIYERQAGCGERRPFHPVIELDMKRGALRARKVSEGPVEVVYEEGKRESLRADWVPLRRSFSCPREGLHFGPLDVAHRVARWRFHGGQGR